MLMPYVSARDYDRANWRRKKEEKYGKRREGRELKLGNGGTVQYRDGFLLNALLAYVAMTIIYPRSKFRS